MDLPTCSETTSSAVASNRSSDEFTNTTCGSNALLGTLGEKLGTNDAW